MVRKLALVLAIILGVMSVPIVWANAASQTPRNLASNLRFVDQRLDRALRLLNTAEEFVNAKQMDKTDRAIDQAMRLVRDAERKADSALSIFRQVKATALSKVQLEQVERLSAEARNQVREAETLIDRTGQKTLNHRKLRGLLVGADKQMDQAMTMLQQIVAGL